MGLDDRNKTCQMMKYLIFIIPGLLFSCSQNETARVSPPQQDTVITNPPVSPLESEITCPKCNFKKKEIMPEDNCLLKYVCTNCKAEIYPDEKDCCVFCTYGTHKCPSKQ